MSPQQVAEFVVVIHVVTLIRVFSGAPAAMMAGDCAVMPAAKHQLVEGTNAGMVCVTVDPVAACPAGCVHSAVESQLMGVHCLPANQMTSSDAKIRLSMLQTPQWKPIDDYATVQVPTACKTAP